MFNRLKRLFSPSNSGEARLCSLLRQYRDELPSPSARNDHQKCLSVLASILDFGFQGRSPIPNLAAYATDSCLFELACYVLSSTDFWAFNKAPDKRQKIQQILFAQLDAICSRSGFLPAEAAFSFANDRVGMYGRIASQSSGMEGLHLRLNQALKHATTHSLPPAHIDDVPPIFGDPFEALGVTKALVRWEMHRLSDMDSILCTIS
ncbi:MAG: hypothetical protein JNJ83_13440 [Verrucomicrobiaceae bacterium]|nr:hypothetical protein [Verrucomicrobiaceae bacterium]